MLVIGNAAGKIIKGYPVRGPISQFRFEKVVAFTCFRCGNNKKSKLISIYQSDWNKRMCNGCYGYLLSVYSIKSGDDSENKKVEKLSKILSKLVNENKIKEQIKTLKIKENRIDHISENTQRFIASSEYISSRLGAEYSLDWSPVVIGLCKAFENELIVKLVRPFKEFCTSLDLSNDIKDKDIGRIAKYIVKRNSKDPELGTFGYFLQTALNSKKRRGTSTLINAFYDFMSNFHNSNWVLDSKGLLLAIQAISQEFRNKAAHIEELNKDDYQRCKDLLIGQSGILWSLNFAVKL